MSLPDTLSKLFAYVLSSIPACHKSIKCTSILFYYFCSYIDNNKVNFIETLIEAVAIKSVSAWPQTRDECQRMMDWAQQKMEAVNVSCRQVDIGTQKMPDGTELKLPNVLTGTLGNVSDICDCFEVFDLRQCELC